MKKSSKAPRIGKKSKEKSATFQIFDTLLGARSAAAISYFGGLLVFAATQSVPGIGTDGQGNLNFGRSPYYFIAEVLPSFTRWGLFLIALGFALQFTDGFRYRFRIPIIIGCIFPFLSRLF